MADNRISFRTPRTLREQNEAGAARFITSRDAFSRFSGTQKAILQRTIDRVRGNGFPLEAAVRPAVPSKAYALLERLLAKRRAPGEESEASIIWGGQSDFTVAELKPPELPKLRGINIGGGDDDTPPEEPAVTIVYQEVARTTHEFTVTNPEDPADFVVIEVIDDITFQRQSDGVFVQFILNNPQ